MLHDLRKNSLHPLLTLNMHSKSINAAYVSPDGEYLVSVSQDDTVRCTRHFLHPTKSQTLLTVTTRHNNFTGRWLSTFRPAFSVQQPNTFLLGSMDQPRKVEVFGVFSRVENSADFGLRVEQNLRSELLASVCSRNCFHPSQNMIACGNSSGRVHLFSE